MPFVKITAWPSVPVEKVPSREALIPWSKELVALTTPPLIVIVPFEVPVRARPMPTES